MSFTKKQRQIRAQILDRIYALGPISRIDISHETGITPATLSAVTGDLMQTGLLHELGEKVSPVKHAGRKKILIDISPDYCYLVGVEISEYYFSFVLTDNLGTIKKQHCAYHDPYDPVYKTSEAFIQDLKQFLASVGDYKVNAIGISLPGHFDPEHPDHILTNNQRWAAFHLSEIPKAVTMPVYFANNVNAMAIAERLFSHKGNDDNYSFFHIGRGMHYSYMYQGDIFSKQNYLIGEIGHTVVSPEGERCECGKRGCLQTYISETWLIKKAAIIFRNLPHTYLRQLVKNEHEITLKTILTAYNLGDSAISTTINLGLKYLALSIMNFNIMIDSPRLYLHGQLFSEPKIQTTLREALDVEPQLLLLPRKQELIFKPYSDYNGAVGGAAICINNQLLHKND